MTTCPYFCLNKTDLGYCKTTVCINPKYNCLSVTKWLEKADYVQVVRCKDCKRYHDSLLCSMYSEGMDTPQDWFCADGERKNNADK